MPPEAAPEALYHCCTPEQIEWALPRRGPQPVLPFTQPFTVPEDTTAFDGLPRAYVTCLQDRAILPALQRRMYTTAGCEPVIEIDTDHSPWLCALRGARCGLEPHCGRVGLTSGS